MKIKRLMVCFLALMMFMSISITAFAERHYTTINGVKITSSAYMDNGSLTYQLSWDNNSKHVYTVIAVAYDSNGNILDYKVNSGSTEGRNSGTFGFGTKGANATQYVVEFYYDGDKIDKQTVIKR